MILGRFRRIPWYALDLGVVTWRDVFNGKAQTFTASNRAHFELERELATRLHTAQVADRTRLYGEVYNELFRRWPDHPQLSIDPAGRQRAIARKLRFLSRFLWPDATFVEIGAGDCALSIAASAQVRRVVAVDVSDAIVATSGTPENMTVALSDGRTIPVDDCSIDLAFSDQLMEHLHSDDAVAQLSSICRALRPGGIYVCITPNRLTGPHDVSRQFAEVSCGLHLREYSATDLEALLTEAGFRCVHFYIGAGGRYLRIPSATARLFEKLAAKMPEPTRRRFGETLLAYVLFGVNAVGIR